MENLSAPEFSLGNSRAHGECFALYHQRTSPLLSLRQPRSTHPGHHIRAHCSSSTRRFYRIWPMGRFRTRMRLCSNVTTAPRRTSSSTTGRFARRRVTCCSGLRPVPRRNKMNEGFAFLRSASRVPKSVSAETTILSSASASAKISSSLAAWRLRSHTWTALCPAFFNSAATSGDSALSTRNFTNR